MHTERLHPPAPRTIALVGPLPPPSGGMANQTRQLERLLNDEGCRVTLVQTNRRYRPSWIGRLRGVREVFRLVPYLARLARAFRGADVVHVMANSGWAWHLVAAPAIWIAAARRVPVIVHYHGGEAARFLSREIAWVRPTLRRAQQIIVPSGYLGQVFAEHGVTTRVVPNVVDLQAFRPAATLPAKPHLIVTRNLEPIYDIETALRAFAIVVRRFPDAQLTVAGSGPERERLLALAGALGLGDRVRFTGRLDNAELPPLYRSASIVVNPSRADNMPVSLLEAFASGVPVVSTNVGGVPYMAQDEVTAILVPAAQPQAMADAMLRVLDDPTLARRLREAGIDAASRYAWPRVRPQLFATYAEACAHGGAPQRSW